MGVLFIVTIIRIFLKELYMYNLSLIKKIITKTNKQKYLLIFVKL